VISCGISVWLISKGLLSVNRVFHPKLIEVLGIVVKTLNLKRNMVKILLTEVVS
jgi:hypothetical protein